MKAPIHSFATFVAGGPSVKIAAVSDAKNAPAYDPMIDWWKQLREFIPRNHKNGGTRADLTKFANGVTPRKQNGYGDRVAAYNKWWGKKAITSASGSAVLWSSGGLDVSVNPELFLNVNGVRHIIKLWFKGSEKLSVDRANVVLRLMEIAYRKGQSPGGATVVAIFDLAQNDFIVPTASLAYLDPLLAGEAASFATIWPNV